MEGNYVMLTEQPRAGSPCALVVPDLGRKSSEANVPAATFRAGQQHGRDIVSKPSSFIPMLPIPALLTHAHVIMTVFF
jgi:hypothetical protein